MNTIPCLSLWQPWATAMLYGPKDLENRPWPIRHRGRLLVHAAKSKNDMRPDVFAQIRKLWPAFDRYPVPMGAIVGVVNVTGCGQVRNFPGNPWAWGPWCHVWADRRAFRTPIPWKGAQGLFAVPAEVVAEQLAALDIAQPEPVAAPEPGGLFASTGATP
jgi:hypothetical protein